MTDNYITIEEYTKKYGINEIDIIKLSMRKAIHKKCINGMIYVLDEAPREAEAEAPTETDTDTDKNTPDTDTENPSPSDREEIERLRGEIEELKIKLEDRENTIKDFALKFAELAYQAQRITAQEQYLHKGDLPEAITAPKEAETDEKITVKKSGIFGKIFGKLRK